jgi:hypothetical protein
VAALVLVLGLVVVFARGGDDEVSIAPGTTVAATAPALTTTPIPLPATTTSTTSTTSTTTTTTTTTTTPPVPAVANAGDDLIVNAAVDVELAAVDLSEDDQSVVWRQTGGPDVTNGTGRLLGAAVTFRSPGRPATLRFEVVVTGRGGDVARDDLRVDVVQEADAALFVDAANGSDDGDGTRERPYRTLARALDEAGGGIDLYLRSTGTAYELGGRVVSGGTSIFGGYDGDWVRDTDRRAIVTGADGVRVEGRGVTILSALEIVGPDLPGAAEAVVAGGLDRLIVEQSLVQAGASSGGRSVGVVARQVDEVFVVESTIRGGVAGRGVDGASAPTDDEPSADGSDAVDRVGAAGGGNGGSGGDGVSGRVLVPMAVRPAAVGSVARPARTVRPVVVPVAASVAPVVSADPDASTGRPRPHRSARCRGTARSTGARRRRWRWWRGAGRARWRRWRWRGSRRARRGRWIGCRRWIRLGRGAPDRRRSCGHPRFDRRRRPGRRWWCRWPRNDRSLRRRRWAGRRGRVDVPRDGWFGRRRWRWWRRRRGRPGRWRRRRCLGRSAHDRCR